MAALLLAALITVSVISPVFATGYGVGTIPDYVTPYTPPEVEPSTPREQPAPSAETPKAVTSTGVQNAFVDAVANADDDPETPTVAVLENVSRVTTNNLKNVFAKAAAAGTTDLVFNLNTTANDGSVVSIITITPEIASTLKGSVNFALQVSGRNVNRAISNVHRHFANENVAAVSLAQKGPYGADIPMAVKVDLSSMDTDNLLFYVFSGLTSKYAQLETDYEIDSAGLLHFSTPVGGNVIITDAPLARRGR
jgi:hypothetical protein